MENITLKRRSTFTGKRSVGLDTGILRKLYEDKNLFDYEQARIFKYNDLVYTHVICAREFAKFLKDKEEAKRFLREKNIGIIYLDVPKLEVSNFEKHCNEQFDKIGRKDLKCHFPDSAIILSFKRFGINKVISLDKSFRESAKLIGIDSTLPFFEFKVGKELKRIYDDQKKLRMKRRR